MKAADREKAEWLAARAGLFQGRAGWAEWVIACVEVIEAARREGRDSICHTGAEMPSGTGEERAKPPYKQT